MKSVVTLLKEDILEYQQEGSSTDGETQQMDHGESPVLGKVSKRYLQIVLYHEFVGIMVWR